MAETPKDWVTLAPNLDAIMAVPNAIIETIDSVLAFMIAILNIANVILNIIKVFLVGLLDPIRAIVEAIIEEVRAFIHDLRQMGVYITGDWNLIEVKPVLRAEELRGGFQQYERRMLKRLLNRRDPGRPDFSSRHAAIALFCYLSTGDLMAMIELIMRIRAFFGDRSAAGPAPFPAPTMPEAKLGASGAPFVAFVTPAKLGAPPDTVSLKWAMPGTGALLAAAPAGFLIHVSTVPNGFGVRGMSPIPGTKPEEVSYQVSVGIDPNTGTELRLFGGVSDLATGDSLFEDVEGDSAQAQRLWLSLDQSTPLIPPSALASAYDGTPLGAATYFMKLGKVNTILPLQSFSAAIPYERLPQSITVTTDGTTSGGLPKVEVTGEDCYNFYARVTPLTAEYVQALNLEGKDSAPDLVGEESLKAYHIPKEHITANQNAVLKPWAPSKPGPKPGTGVVAMNLGPSSPPVTFNMPTAASMDLIEATRASLGLLLLCRPDYTEQVSVTWMDDEVDYIPAANTYKVACGLESLKDLLTVVKANDKMYNTRDNAKFTTKVNQKSQTATSLMFAEPPSDGIAEALAEQVDAILGFKWSDANSNYPDMTIIETLEYKGGDKGFAANPSCVGGLRYAAYAGRLKELNRDFQPERDTENGSPMAQLMEAHGHKGFIYGQGWSDATPVIFQVVADPVAGFIKDWYVSFVRDVLNKYDGGSLLQSAQVILSITGASVGKSPSQSEWIQKRVLNDALAPVDALLSDVEKYLQGILDGLEGMVDKIVAYIEAIQARIYQIQQLIEMIRALLASLTAFDLVSFSGLLLVENGTDGITKGLVMAGNKPSDSSISYGGGVLVMAGGLPTILLEILELILGGGGE